MSRFLTYEDELDYLASFVEDDSATKCWENAVEELGENIHFDSLRKAFFTTKWSGYNVYQYFKNKNISYLADEEIEKIEKAKDELFKERVRRGDKLREINKHLRAEARFEELIENVKDAILCLPEIKVANKKNIAKDCTKSALLQISDIHYGLSVDNVINLYNKDVAKERLALLTSKTIKICKENKVKELHIALNGDLLAGNIHISNRVSQDTDVITSIMELSEILSHCINALKEHFDIKVYGVVGNHSRLFQNKADNTKFDNFERMVFEYITIRTNQPIIKNGLEDFINFKVNNFEVVVTHGDKDSVSNAKKHFCDILKKVPDEIHLGHYHHLQMLDDNGTEIVVNGSIVSTDDYAMSLRKTTKPYQVLRIYGDDISTYKLDLSEV